MSRNRGKPKPKLRDLGRIPPTDEEIKALRNAAQSADPIVTAILGAVLVEHELDNHLRKRVAKKNDDVWSDMVSEAGPFSTFSRKIMAGHALGIFDEHTKDNLNIVRVIRNAFAHSKKLIDFNNPLVVAELGKIKFKSAKEKNSWMKHAQSAIPAIKPFA
jgi:DNA-binding MltR family transcriptional regulator